MNSSERAGLFALLRLRPRRWTKTAITEEVAATGSALEVLERSYAGALLPPDEVTDALTEAESALAAWDRAGLRLVTVLDDDYPERLRDIREMPPFLFYRGELVADEQGASIVGSRSASPEARAFAAEVARLLVGMDLSVLSGLAVGIDAAAHHAALESGGRTVAFLGTGIDQHYPAVNRELQDQVAARGLLLSQFLPGAPPRKQTFPMRNAVMSGYGIASIVVEAGEHSGTRIQARKAGEHGRPVVLMKRVVDATSWGKQLDGRANVYVADSLGDVQEAVAEIQRRRDSLVGALQKLVR